VQFEMTKIRLLNELYYLEETIVRGQRDLREMEEVLERHKSDLAAVQLEVLVRILFALFAV